MTIAASIAAGATWMGEGGGVMKSFESSSESDPLSVAVTGSSGSA